MLCLKNKASGREQIFSMNLGIGSGQFFLNFSGDASDLFKQTRPRVYKARKIKTGSFQDVLVSYKSVFTESAHSPGRHPKGRTREARRPHEEGRASSQSGRGDSDSFDNLFKKKNFSVFSFVKLLEKPYIKIKNLDANRAQDKQDFYVGVTNLESMKRFFVKFEFDFQNRSPFEPSIRVDPDSSQVLEAIRQPRTRRTIHASISLADNFNFLPKHDLFYRGRTRAGHGLGE